MEGRRLFTLVCLFSLATVVVAQGQTPSKPTPPDQQIVAVVNGVPITRLELGEELIQRRGKAQLDSLINRRIIEQACGKSGIVVSDKEVEDELRELMRANGFTTAMEFEKQMVRPMLHISLAEYKEDVLKQGILTRRLAGKRIEVTDTDLRRAFESKYGERVQCRIIVEKSLKVATDMYTKIGGKRENFLAIARQQAEPSLARFAGQFPPIGRYTSNDDLEKRAFEMKDGEVSEVLQLPQGGFAILLREQIVPPDTTKKFEEEKAQLVKEVTEMKVNQEVPKLVAELKKQATVEDYFTNSASSLKGLLEKQAQNK